MPEEEEEEEEELEAVEVERRRRPLIMLFLRYHCWRSRCRWLSKDSSASDSSKMSSPKVLSERVSFRPPVWGEPSTEGSWQPPPPPFGAMLAFTSLIGLADSSGGDEDCGWLLMTEDNAGLERLRFEMTDEGVCCCRLVGGAVQRKSREERQAAADDTCRF